MQKLTLLFLILLCVPFAKAQDADTIKIFNNNAPSRSLINGPLTSSTSSSLSLPNKLIQLDPVSSKLNFYEISNGVLALSQNLPYDNYSQTDILRVEGQTTAQNGVLVVSSANTNSTLNTTMTVFSDNLGIRYASIGTYNSQAVSFSRLAKDENQSVYGLDVNSNSIIKMEINVAFPSISLMSHVSLNAIPSSSTIKDFGVWNSTYYVLTTNTIYVLNSNGAIDESFNVNSKNTFGETVVLERLHVDPNGRLVLIANGLALGIPKVDTSSLSSSQGQYLLIMWRDGKTVLENIDLTNASTRGNYNYLKDITVHSDGSFFIGEGSSTKVHHLTYLNHVPFARNDYSASLKVFELLATNEGSKKIINSSFFEFADYNFHQKLDSIRIKSINPNLLGDLYFDENKNDIFEQNEKFITATEKRISAQDLDDGRLVFITDTTSKAAYKQDSFSFFVSDGYEWNANLMALYTHIYPKKIQINGVQGKSQWRLLSNFREHQSIQSFLEPLWTQGAIGSDAPAEDPNIFRYSTPNETWNAVTNLSDTLNQQEALLVYIYEDDDPRVNGIQGGWPKFLYPDSSKTIMHKEYADNSFRRFDLDYSTNLGGSAQYQGFNLVGNITGMVIDYSSLNSNQIVQTQNVIYSWNPTINNGNGAYEYWEPSTGGTRGTDLIRPGEAVWFKATNTNASIGISVSSFLVSDAVAPKVIANAERFELNISNADFEDHVILSTTLSSDVQKMPSLSTNYHEVYIRDEKAFIQKGIDLSNDVEIPIGIRSTVSAIATLSFKAPSSYLGYSYLKLKSTDESDIYYSLENDVQLNLLDNDGLWVEDGNYSIVLQSKKATSSEELKNLIPTQFSITSYPNPFNPSTSIKVDLPESTNLSIQIYDVTGRIVKNVLENKMSTSGSHTFKVNMNEHSSGLYFVRVTTTHQDIIQKITLIK